MSNEILLYIGALAILDMFSPAIIGVTVYVLLVGKRKQTQLIMAYLMTVIGFYFCTGVFLMLGLDIIFKPIADVLSSDTAKKFMTIIGAILFIGSWFVPKKKIAESPKPRQFNVSAMIALGISTSLLEVATAIPYFASIGLMISNEFTMYEWLPVLAGYNVMMVAPALVLLLLHILFRRFMQRPLRNLQALFQKNTSSALSWVMFIVGIILLANGSDFG
ncbi:GAP family protein [Lysinibacillus sp. NPDC096418]|uniref:GAP family protein n=1 Tax=Lysinibacillus sp. NPDC096418 TaxID=3364138 RepID=UPI00381F1517